MIDAARFNRFTDNLKQYNPKLNIQFKDESVFMKLLGKLVFFNKGFMTTYTTTIGNTISFPSRKFVEEKPESALIVVAHEYRHTRDNKRLSILYPLLYLSPQILALLTILFVVLFGWWGLVGMAFLLPIPSCGRTVLEVHGYTMSLFILHEIMLEEGRDEVYREHHLRLAADKINKDFIGPNYYFMWPFGVLDKLLAAIPRIITYDILNDDDAYRNVKEAFNKSAAS